MSSIGVVFPQTELGADGAAVRRYALAVQELGYRHVMAYDHVLGADRTVHRALPDYAYDADSQFHEPLVTFGFLAALTDLELFTGVLVLPQRQTALVAKQAAQLDILSQGRLRLGVGVGWNSVEYQALGQDFSTRGRRVEEQIALLRQLWTQRTVNFSGEFDTVDAAGLAPPPVQRPIPVWIGAHVAAGYRRAGRLAEGWFPEMAPGPQLAAAAAIVAQAAAGAGRDPSSLGMLGRVHWRDGRDVVLADIEGWIDAGATHVAVNTMNAGLRSVDEHIDALTILADELGTRPAAGN